MVWFFSVNFSPWPVNIFLKISQIRASFKTSLFPADKNVRQTVAVDLLAQLFQSVKGVLCQIKQLMVIFYTLGICLRVDSQCHLYVPAVFEQFFHNHILGRRQPVKIIQIDPAFADLF